MKKALLIGSALLITCSSSSIATVPLTAPIDEPIAGPVSMSQKQAKLLNLAYVTAKSSGLKNPRDLQSILLQETLAGGLKSYRVANSSNTTRPYYGLTQITAAAAKDVMKRFPKMYEKYGFHTQTDDELKAFLILDDKFNLEIAAKYLKILESTYNFTGDRLLTAYNQGPNAKLRMPAFKDPYVVGAKEKLKSFPVLRVAYVQQ